MHKFIVQVFCTGMGWVNSKHGGNTREEAEAAEKLLLADDSAWVNPGTPRQTRLVAEEQAAATSRVFTVRTGDAGDLLCEYKIPVFNLTIGNFTTPKEVAMPLGEPRAATMREITAYRRLKTPHAFLDLNRRG